MLVPVPLPLPLEDSVDVGCTPLFVPVPVPEPAELPEFVPPAPALVCVGPGIVWVGVEEEGRGENVETKEPLDVS